MPGTRPGMTKVYLAQIEGKSSFACVDAFAMMRVEGERDHGAAAATELRILRQGSAAVGDRCADLLLRMHVLRGLRGKQAIQRLPELRRRFRAAADPPVEGVAAWRVRDQARAVGQAGASEVQPR